MISFGFYDSLNHDRRYNAIQFGSIFDGIVRDGIFMSIGSCFRVTPGDGMIVLVGIGRAWFNHTWTLNDAPLPITLPQSEVLLDRIDAIVLDIDQNQEKRTNSVTIIKGTPSKTPQQPTLINNTNHHQYPLAYISVRAGVTEIRAADITSMVGTSSAPYVTGILETVNLDALLDQWKDQLMEFSEFWRKEWTNWYVAQTAEIQEAFLAFQNEWDAWYTAQTGMMDETARYWKDLWNAWFYTYTNQSQNGLSAWIDNTKTGFMEWWDSLKDTLNESCCAILAQRVLELEQRATECEQFRNILLSKQEMYDVIYDTAYDKDLGYLTNQDNIELTNDQGEILNGVGESDPEPILDTEMNPIKSTLKIAIL